MIGMVNLANMNLRAVVPLIANILRAIGFVVLCIGVYKLVRIYAVSTTPLSPTLVDDGFAADGYIIVALFLELGSADSDCVQISYWTHRACHLVCDFP